jgi:endonuclease G
MAGPILFRGKHKTIGQNVDVVVPEAFFKVVYCPSEKKAIGFIYRNKSGNRPKGDYVNSVAQIERITGFKFLTALPAKEAAKVKQEANLDDWY